MNLFNIVTKKAFKETAPYFYSSPGIAENDWICSLCEPFLLKDCSWLKAWKLACLVFGLSLKLKTALFYWETSLFAVATATLQISDGSSERSAPLCRAAHVWIRNCGLNLCEMANMTTTVAPVKFSTFWFSWQATGCGYVACHACERMIWSVL